MSFKTELSDESSKTRVAILGRPNVGKSTFFNLLTGTRKAVVKNQPGVTRDVQIEPAEIWGHHFEILDMGGVTDATDQFSKMIKEQVQSIIKEVDLLVVVMDGKFGLCPEDRDIIQIAKTSQKKFLLVVNKVDSPTNAEMVKSEFYEFGEDVYDASFEQRRGLSDICEWLIQNQQETLVDHEADLRKGVRLTVIGKPNVGKSSLCNFLLGESRMMVSDVAGTTIDSIDSGLEWEGKQYVLTDTAGLRRSAKRRDDVEIISAFKSHSSIDRADVVLLMVDGLLGPSDQDARLLQYVLEQHKAVILVVNKTDLGEKEIEKFRSTLRGQIAEEFHFFVDIPICFISAKTGAGIGKMFAAIDDLWRKLHTRIPTSELNDFFFQAIRGAPAPVYGTRNVKFYYLTQTNQVPPSFIAFANHPDGVNSGYRRFLKKRIQERFDLFGVPIRIFAMKSRSH